MLQLARRSVTVLLAMLALAVHARGEGILDHVPSDALGVAMVRNLAATDAKVQRVMQIFAEVSGMPPVAPWTMVRAMLDIGDGVDDAGDALLALLPADNFDGPPKPMLLIATSHYGEFAATVRGDASGEICRVTIAGQEVLLARRGDYALLMNLEHRPTMEALLAVAPRPEPVFAEFADWLSQNDLAIIVPPAGLNMAMTQAQSQLAAERAASADLYGDPLLSEAAGNILYWLALYDKLLTFGSANLHAVAVGAAIDDATNIRVSNQVLLKADSPLAVAERASDGPDPLAGFPAEPFVLAGGGPVPAALQNDYPRFARSLIEQAPKAYGYEAFEEPQWQKFEESWRLALGMRSLSLGMLAGKKDDALLGNIFAIAVVDDAQAYVADIRKSFELWNDVTETSTSDIQIVYDISDVDIGTRRGLALVADVGAEAGDDRVPMLKPIWETVFGKGGKLQILVVPVDAKSVVMAIASETAMSRAVEQVAANEQGLLASPEVAATRALLDAKAPWKFLISPAGWVEWCQRGYELLLATIGAPALTIPAFPASPPIGVSVNLEGQALHSEVVLPESTLKGLAAYIKAWMETAP